MAVLAVGLYAVEIPESADFVLKCGVGIFPFTYAYLSPTFALNLLPCERLKSGWKE